MTEKKDEMSNKKWGILAIIAIIVAAVVGGLLFWQKKEPPPIAKKPPEKVHVPVTPKPVIDYDKLEKDEEFKNARKNAADRRKTIPGSKGSVGRLFGNHYSGFSARCAVRSFAYEITLGPTGPVYGRAVQAK